jgi:cytochrome c oxidase cbb3-type subunit 4
MSPAFHRTNAEEADMEVYTAMRQFADSWGLLGMFLFFIGVVIWTLRPGSKRGADEAAQIPLVDDREL